MARRLLLAPLRRTKINKSEARSLINNNGGGCIGRVVRAALLVAATVGFAHSAAWADDRFTVCSVTINSDDEIRLLRKRLPEAEFRFVELTDYAGSSSAAGEESWFGRACESGVQCDVLVVSGHFGNTWAGNYGTTFAGRSGVTLALDELEQRRCEQSCSGILGNPLEVFLLGCKTLAEADGPRLSAADARAFSAHQVTPATAERVLDEVRNGGEPTSSRERMEFVFAGVPHIYGFTDVAPSGRRVAPHLERYLKLTGDYAAHLRRLRAAARAKRSAPNQLLASALDETCFAESSGLEPTTFAHARQEQMCVLRDERRPIEERFAQVERLAAAPGFAAYLPAVDALLRAHAPGAQDAPAMAAFERLRQHQPARTAVLELIRGLETPILRLELVRMARSLGWLSAQEALPTQRQIAIRLLHPPVWGEGRDFICGMDRDVIEKIDIRAEDVPPDVYRDEYGIQALACLRPADERIHAALARSLSDSRVWIARLTAKALKRIKSRT